MGEGILSNRDFQREHGPCLGASAPATEGAVRQRGLARVWTPSEGFCVDKVLSTNTLTVPGNHSVGLGASEHGACPHSCSSLFNLSLFPSFAQDSHPQRKTPKPLEVHLAAGTRVGKSRSTVVNTQKSLCLHYYLSIKYCVIYLHYWSSCYCYYCVSLLMIYLLGNGGW